MIQYHCEIVWIYRKPIFQGKLGFDILGQEDIFKLVRGNIPKGIYQNLHLSYDIEKNFACWGSMHICMPCLVYPVSLLISHILVCL